jgi:hypothetical protein
MGRKRRFGRGRAQFNQLVAHRGQKQVDVIDLSCPVGGGELGEQGSEIGRDRGGEHRIRLPRERCGDLVKDRAHVRGRQRGDVLQRRPG